MARENGEMEIFCSSQNPTQIQMSASEVLKVPSNRINVRVKRMGQCGTIMSTLCYLIFSLGGRNFTIVLHSSAACRMGLLAMASIR